MRIFGGETISYLSVFATTAVCVSVFLTEGLNCPPLRAADSPCGAEFVSLSAANEEIAWRATKTAFRRQGAEGRLYANLTFDELPRVERTDVVTPVTRTVPPSLPRVSDGCSAYLPSQKAPAPTHISADESCAELPFSRDELLNLNMKGF